MNRVLVLAAMGLMVFGASEARSDLVYSVDFENPPHVVDQQVVTGSGTDRPSFADTSVIVRDGPADFTTQVASLEPAGAMSFSPGTVFTTGIALVSWDMAMISLGSSGPETAAIALNPSPGPASPIVIFFMEDLSIELSLGGVDPSDVGSFVLGQQDGFAVQIDLDNGLYDFSMNGSVVLNDQPLGSDWNLSDVSFSRDNLADPTYAVDNFEWEIIPEPGTVFLLALGALGLVAGRVFKRE